MTIDERNSIINDMAEKLGLRTYQKDCANKVITCFLDSYSKDFLISACCRYGKTTTALSICKMMMAVLNLEDMVICVNSGLPGSVKSSWRDDATRLNFINNIEDLNVENIDFNKTTGVDITFISTQKLGSNTNADGEKVEHSYIKEYKDFFNNHKGLKIVLADEAHNAFGTDRTTEALSELNYDYKIELTATPFTEELINKYRLDTTIGDNRSYFFSQIDMLKLYNSASEIILEDGTIAKSGFTYKDKNTGKVKAWRPVQPVVIIEDLHNKLLAEGVMFESLDEESNQTAFVTSYFKTIFSNTKTYKKYCDTFIETYILDFAAKHDIKNFLAFSTTNELANKIAVYINKNYGDRIHAKSLADEKVTNDETSADKANTIFATEDNKIHFVITCRKCGTGSSMPLLNVTMFLKGIVSYIDFCQFIARSYNPCDGKQFGYTILFNSQDALQMIAQHAGGEKHKLVADVTDASSIKNIQEYLEFIKVFLDGSECTDATELVNKLDSVYTPNQTVLFPSLDLMDKSILDEITDVVIMKAKFKPRAAQKPKTGSDPEDLNLPRLDGRKASTKKSSDENTYTKESLMKSFQNHFVQVVVDLCQDGFSEEDIRAISDDSDNCTKRFISKALCSMRLWNRLRVEYFDKVLHKVYIYAQTVASKEADDEE